MGVPHNTASHLTPRHQKGGFLMDRAVPPRRTRRSGRLLWAVASFGLALPLPVVAVLANLSLSSKEVNPLTCRVVRGDFYHEISVQGEVESAVNAEVRCEVHSESSSWIRILEVVPEGKRVKPGDFLVRLDASGLEADRDRERITNAKLRALVIQAESQCESAKLAKQAYLGDTYRLAEESAKSALMVAEDAKRRAQEFLECSRKLESHGYITDLQLRADEFASKAAQTDLRMAQIKLAVLQSFTKPVRLTQLSTAVVTAQARLAAAQVSYNLSCQRLKFVEDQIRKCVVRAHVSGQVVLAHLFHYGHAHMIEPGEVTLEKRVLVRLPDFRHMQVAAQIEEDKIALVRPGLPVMVRLEAFPHAVIRGRIKKINEYPEAEDWLGSAVKKYKTIVSIDAPPAGTRPGMTADLTIHLSGLKSRLQVPCPAVIRHGDRNYCITPRGDEFQAREVSLGPSNGMSVIVREGLREGEEVVLSAAAHRDKVQLPELKRRLTPSNSLTANVQAASHEGRHN